MVAPPVSETELVANAIRGDQQALAEIVSSNERMVYNVALRLLADPGEAECVLQETFLKVLEALPNFKGRSSLSTWIYRIATNFALMRLRSRKKEADSLDDIETRVSQSALQSFNRSVGNNPLQAVMNEELRQAMEKAVAQLPDKFRSVFVLKDIEGFSLKEIADMMQMNPAAVKTNLHRARLFLRNRLAEFIEQETG
ncbi:sigma-70 family RNA polymerase sigma factor [candidate division KSB1 bacterium]|nr:sigma-70 family RNA polymerase sigma factor [candidate division KSB1 bacterium]